MAFQAQGVGAITKDNCVITRVQGKAGKVTQSAAEPTAADGTVWSTATNESTWCFWPSNAADDRISAAQCFAAANGKIVGKANHSLQAGGAVIGNVSGCAAEIAA